MKNINLHIKYSYFNNESRILKETASIIKTNAIDEIIIVARYMEGYLREEIIDENRKIIRIRTVIPSNWKGGIIGILRFIEWLIRIIYVFRNLDITHVNPHSIIVLPIGLFYKIFFKSKLIYDPHELETRTIGAIGIKGFIIRLMERNLIKYADAVITVTKLIRDWYVREYNLENVFVVRNIPNNKNRIIQKNDLLRTCFKLKNNDQLYIYNGGLFNGRGIGNLLKIFSELDNSKHIVFMGFGVWENTIKKYEKEYNNIHFHVAVHPDDVVKYTSGADVGLSIPDSSCLSYQYSESNKLFEYIMSGIPIIVRDFLGFKNIIEEGKCGWIINNDINEIKALIHKLTFDDISEKRRNTISYSKTLGWKNEEKVLLEIYDKVLINS